MKDILEMYKFDDPSEKPLDNYPVDAILDVGIRNQFNITEAFGEGS